MGAEYIKLIWVPDTFFVNEKIALFHQATTENQFLRITHTGEVLRSMRLTIKATCPMNLANFPFDEQMCTVEIESFGYTMADLKYRWEDGNKSVQMSPDVALPQFLVLGHRQRFIEVSLSSGNYSRLLADVQFIRSMGYYMIQVSIHLKEYLDGERWGLIHLISAFTLQGVSMFHLPLAHLSYLG